ncbi:MAG: flavodoxin domain-containing protein [Candidatus Thorarchaeota archaeon]|nr:flavodoxin domain-containing protein [Candidatus Thorarchaeota archaeon]
MSNITLVCYGTRYGSTAEVAAEIAKTIEESGGAVEVVDLKKTKPSRPVSEYSLVVVGTGIQAGKWTKEPAKFLKDNAGSLAGTKVALFVVCGYAANPVKCSEAQSEYLDKVVASYPSVSFIKTGLFGGVFDFTKYNMAVKTIIKMMVWQQSGAQPPEKIDFRDWDKIREWARSLVLS